MPDSEATTLPCLALTYPDLYATRCVAAEVCDAQVHAYFLSALHSS